MHHTCCWRRPWQLEVNDHGLHVHIYITLTIHLQYTHNTHYIGPWEDVEKQARHELYTYSQL